MASAATIASPALSAYGNAAFEKVEVEIKSPKTAPKFDPVKHMCFEPPKEITTLKELLLSEENAISPVAITEPFPLFTLEAVKEMRADIFRREVVEKHGQKVKPGVYKMRGYSKDTPFVDSVWRNEEVLKACSKAAGVDLQVVFDYEIGHVNVQVDAIADTASIADVLPPAEPPRTAVASTITKTDEAEQLASVGNWHVDSYPWVCVCMLSDPTGMTGGETGLEKGDGSILKVRGPGIGWAVMMQGGCIKHIALKAFGTGERVTMVTSFRPKDPLARDGSTLRTTIKSSKHDELFQQWTTYRMDLVSKRALALKEEFQQEKLTADEIKEKMTKWVKEQTSYLEFTVSQMTQ